MTAPHVTEEPTTERWSALGGVLLSALYLWVIVWLLLAVLLPSLGLGWKPVVITSGSMEPLIRPGDVVLAAVDDDLEPGQVITYQDPARMDSLTTHRVLSVNEDGTLRTQGDANPTPDSTAVPRDNVLGRGRLLVPLIGLPLVWLSGGAVLFGLWVVVTAVSVAVVVGASGRGGPPPPSARAGTRRAVRRLAPLFHAVRPRTVQQVVVRALVDAVQRLHDRVYRGYRPNPSRLRRGAPSLVLLAVVLGLARTPAMVGLGAVALVTVLLFDPDGPQFRIGRWERLAVRSVRAVTAVVPLGLGGRGIIAIAMVVAVGASAVGRSAATFSAAADNTGSTFTASSAFPTDDLTLYLHNDPEGQDTTDQEFQPMRTEVPTQTTLPNYDTNADGDAGLRLKKGANGLFDGDRNKIQRWRYTAPADTPIASAQIVFHSAVKAFAQGKGGTVTWHLRHCNASGSDCVELARQDVTASDWQAGSTTFVERTTGFGTISAVVPAGRVLEVVTYSMTFDDDLWFAYDTAAQPSRLELTTPTAGVCPGPGSSTQHVIADARVEQDNPTNNFSGNNELDVRSDLGKNKRSYLTVALPIIPDGCSLSGATLHLTTRTSKTGRTILAQRASAAVDPATVTWATQPATSGALGSGPSTGNGPTPIDVLGPVQELYTLGNTGLQLRDSVEDESTSSENRFHSLESRPYPDAEGPRLEVTWGP